MDAITNLLRDHYERTFLQHGMTARGVDWNDETELLVRYDKMLMVLQKDFTTLPPTPSLLDVGCGWGGLLRRIREQGLPIDYTGVDVVDSMIAAARNSFTDARFIHGDIYDFDQERAYDFVVCNAILTQKLGVSIPEMERYAKTLITKMFDLCRHGIAFNMMSTRVNYMVDNLFYQNPADLLSWLLTEVSARVRLDHGYSSLGSGKGRFYDFTVYVYRDDAA